MDNAQYLMRLAISARLTALLERAEALTRPALKTLADALANYDSRLTEMAEDFTDGAFTRPTYRRGHKNLLQEMAELAFREAWLEGGGDPDDVESTDLELMADWLDAQTAHVNAFSDWLAETRQMGDAIDDRVRDWVSSLRNLGEQVKARAMGDPQLKYDGDDGAESCDECQEYKGQTHRLSWWEARGLTARNGNENYGCKRFDNCHHSFFHAKTGDLVIQ